MTRTGSGSGLVYAADKQGFTEDLQDVPITTQIFVKSRRLVS